MIFPHFFGPDKNRKKKMESFKHSIDCGQRRRHAALELLREDMEEHRSELFELMEPDVIETRWPTLYKAHTVAYEMAEEALTTKTEFLESAELFNRTQDAREAQLKSLNEALVKMTVMYAQERKHRIDLQRRYEPELYDPTPRKRARDLVPDNLKPLARDVKQPRLGYGDWQIAECDDARRRVGGEDEQI
jgi:hypothetical protein